MGERLGTLTLRLHAVQNRKTTRFSHQLQQLNQRLQRNHPSGRINLLHARLTALGDKLRQGSVHNLNLQQSAVQQYAARLNILSPLATLSRGYVIMEEHGRALSHCAKILPGQAVQARFQDGVVHCKVQEVEMASVGTLGTIVDNKKGQKALF